MAYPYISLVVSPLNEDVRVAIEVRLALCLLLLFREADADDGNRVVPFAATVVINKMYLFVCLWSPRVRSLES